MDSQFAIHLENTKFGSDNMLIFDVYNSILDSSLSDENLIEVQRDTWVYNLRHLKNVDLALRASSNELSDALKPPPFPESLPPRIIDADDAS